MARRRGEFLPVEELLEAFAHSGKVNELLLASLPAKMWRARPPGDEGRCIAEIAAHMYSLRRAFAKLGGARPAPPILDRKKITPAQARAGLRRTDQAFLKMFRASLESGRGRVPGLPRRTVNMMAYLMQHDAHHRGQISSLARRLGFRPTRDLVMRLWGWKKFSS
jgi:uncharacterized damage-inducible protein DinB